MDGVIMKRKHLGDHINELYRTHRTEPFLGIFIFHIPTLLVNDLELIKRVLIRDFNHFNSHGTNANDDFDPFGGHLFNLSGDKWKKLRTKLSPTFTTGKLRMMFDRVVEVQATMGKHLSRATAERDEVNFAELFSLYTIDIISNCVFGINTDSFQNPNSLFRKYAIESVAPTKFLSQLGFTMQVIAPELGEMLHLRAQSKELVNFFTKMVEQTVEYREKNGINTNDFMQLLIQMKNNNLRDDDGELIDSGGLTLKEMVAQVFLFLIAGFESSSSTAASTLYQLALNPDIQNKTRQHIVQVLENNGGACTFETIGEMKYLTMVIQETLRLHPTLSFLTRKCIKDYKMPDSDLVVKEGNMMVIPVEGIHMDPEIYSSPLAFNPDRFLPEEKAKRHPLCWLPFGEGPRMCIAYRLGYMQIKLALIEVLTKYEVVPCKRTQVPFIVNPAAFAVRSRDGIVLKVKPIQ